MQAKIYELFQELDNTTTDANVFSNNLAIIANCLGIYLANNLYGLSKKDVMTAVNGIGSIIREAYAYGEAEIKNREIKEGETNVDPVQGD